MYVMTVPTAQDVLSNARPPAASLPKAGPGYKDSEPDRLRSPRGAVVADLVTANGASPRLAFLNISFGPLASPSPCRSATWGARFWEVDPPPGAKPVEWLLGSTGAVTCLEQALELLDGTQGLVTSYAVT